MKVFQVGDKARLIQLPTERRHLINKIVTICPIGGYGYEDDDVCVQLEEGGSSFLIKEHQMVKV